MRWTMDEARDWQAICAGVIAGAYGSITKPLLTGFAVIAALSMEGPVLSSYVLQAYATHQGALGQRELGTTPRPPSAIPDLTDRPLNVAVSALDVRDSHVLEFLRWKEQLRTEIGGMR
jgi:hypothetical protein